MDEVQVITWGGTLAGLKEEWTHLLSLDVRDIGVFFLSPSTVEPDVFASTLTKRWDYCNFPDSATSVFNIKHTIFFNSSINWVFDNEHGAVYNMD